MIVIKSGGIFAAQSMHQYLVLDEECEMDADETELRYLFDAVDAGSSSDSSSSSSSSSDKKARLVFMKIIPICSEQCLLEPNQVC